MRVIKGQERPASEKCRAVPQRVSPAQVQDLEAARNVAKHPDRFEGQDGGSKPVPSVAEGGAVEGDKGVKAEDKTKISEEERGAGEREQEAGRYA